MFNMFFNLWISNSYFEFNDAYVHSGEAFYAGGNSILTLEGHDILLDPSGSDGLDFSDTSTTLINVNDIVGGNSHWNIHYRTSTLFKKQITAPESVKKCRNDFIKSINELKTFEKL